MDAESLSNALDGKPTDKGFIACCPAHNDKSPSLSIADADNGNTLIHCFAGCSPDSIMKSIGLEIRDLFNNSSLTHIQQKKYKKTKHLSELWQALNHELHVLLQIVSNRICDEALSKDKAFIKTRKEFKPLPTEFWPRELLAAKRIKIIIGDLYEL